MKNSTIIPVVVAGACGLVAVLGIQQYLAAKGAKEVVETRQVLVAAAPISQGVPLDELNTKFITVELATAPEGVVTTMDEVAERSLKIARNANDWIMLDQLGEKGQTGASAVIPTGMRVATIPVDATTNHSGMLRPGNRIDLLLSYKVRDPETRDSKQAVKPLLQYIEVFAVDNQVYGVSTAGGDNNKARNISLLVDTEQMMLLKIAQDKGSISTVLRSNEDKEEMSLSEMNEDVLNGRTKGELNETSTVGFFDDLKDQDVAGFALPEEAENSVAMQLQAELTAPVEPAEPEYWTMVIHEAGSSRRERVNLASEEPLYDPTGSAPSPSGPSPVRTSPVMPPRVGAEEIPEMALPEGLNIDFGDGGFEEAASGLLDLLQ